ncbi:Uncharacterised protein [Salmonella enterica]|uniref:Uncharacterized protein n=1 Tax=Salmonella sp. NCTC 6947 TaxID=2583581 RepID=A0A509BD81_9ENTR|nr:Uncharacterised protein [Salmonella enterica]
MAHSVNFAPLAAPTLRSASAAVVRGMGRVPAADSKPRDDRPVGFLAGGED